MASPAELQAMARALTQVGIDPAGMPPEQIVNAFSSLRAHPTRGRFNPGSQDMAGQVQQLPPRRNFPPPGGQGPMTRPTPPAFTNPPGGQGPMSPRLAAPEGPPRGGMPTPMARPNMPMSPNAPRTAPRPWLPPEFMRPSQLQVGAVSPSTAGDPVMGPAMAEERARRGLAPNAPVFPPSPNAPRGVPPSNPQATGNPRELKIPPRTGAPTAPAPAGPPDKAAAKEMVAKTLGGDKAEAVDRMPEWAMPMLVAGLATLANRDKGFAAVGEGGLAGVEFWQAQKDREFRQARELADAARADRGLANEERRTDISEQQVSNTFQVDNERLANDRQRIGLEALQVAQGDRALDLRGAGLALEGGRLDLDKARMLLEEKKIGIDQYNSLVAAQDSAWRRGFAERELGQDLLKFHDNLLLEYGRLGIDAERAAANSEYLGAMIAQMASNRDLGMLNYLLEKSKTDPKNAGVTAEMVVDIIEGIYSSDPLATPEISRERAATAIKQLKDEIRSEGENSEGSGDSVIVDWEDLE